jgi:hypothetical protein
MVGYKTQEKTMFIQLLNIVAKENENQVAVVMVDNKEIIVRSGDDCATCLEDGFYTWSASGPANETEIKSDKEYVGKPFMQFIYGEKEMGITLHNVEMSYDEGRNLLKFSIEQLRKGVHIHYHNGAFKR